MTFTRTFKKGDRVMLTTAPQSRGFFVRLSRTVDHAVVDFEI